MATCPLKAYMYILGIHMRIFASHRCADYARVSHAVAGEARVAHVTFAVEAVWCVSSIQATMALPRHHPRPPSPLPKDTVIHPSI